jgi:hypothetical protein
MLTTLEQNDSIDALDSVQTREAIIEDRGEWVFTLVGAALAFGVGVWAVMGEQWLINAMRGCQRDGTGLRLVGDTAPPPFLCPSRVASTYLLLQCP